MVLTDTGPADLGNCLRWWNQRSFSSGEELDRSSQWEAADFRGLLVKMYSVERIFRHVCTLIDKERALAIRHRVAGRPKRSEQI